MYEKNSQSCILAHAKITKPNDGSNRLLHLPCTKRKSFMQRNMFFIAFTAVCILVILDCQADQDASKPVITFYETPLVCNAAPFGCGSRSKPMLLALEQDRLVQEAWLNRAGTIIAVVWNPAAKQSERNALIERISSAQDIPLEEMSPDRRKALAADFGTADAWYRGREVDKLSIEEAEIIAERIIGMIRRFHDIDEDAAVGMQAGVKNVFAKWFTTDELAAEMLGKRRKQANAQIEQELIAVGRHHLGEEVMYEIIRKMEEAGFDPYGDN